MDTATITKISTYEAERGKPMPSKNHAIIQRNLIVILSSQLNGKDVLPELSLNIDGKERIPDLAVFASVSFMPFADEIKVTQAPMTTIEILSSTQKISDLTTKSGEYFDFGVQSYWLVIPELRSIYVFSSSDKHEVFANEEILSDPTLGIELDLKRVFGEKFRLE